MFFSNSKRKANRITRHFRRKRIAGSCWPNIYKYLKGTNTSVFPSSPATCEPATHVRGEGATTPFLPRNRSNQRPLRCSSPPDRKVPQLPGNVPGGRRRPSTDPRNPPPRRFRAAASAPRPVPEGRRHCGRTAASGGRVAAGDARTYGPHHPRKRLTRRAPGQTLQDGGSARQTHRAPLLRLERGPRSYRTRTERRPDSEPGKAS